METVNNNEPPQRFNTLNDFLFFKVMGEKGNEAQLTGFLNAVLGRSGKKSIETVEILENQSYLKDIISGKSCILDVLAILTDKTKVNIEVQLSNKGNMDRRSLFYWSKVYFESLAGGQDYRELPNVININIVDFNFLPDENVHTCFNLREATNPSLILSSALEIHFINMLKWRKQEDKDIVNNSLHRWLTWFDERSPPELIAEVINMDSAIKAANERQTYVTQDEEARRIYWSRRKAEHDLVSGLNHARREGREEGKTEEKLEIAMNLLAKGSTPEFVQEITGLKLEAIRKLRPNNG
jgi:predicted transposase/invertase (TIGR01784 family)